MTRPAAIAKDEGLKGASPSAIRSALTNTGQSASKGKNSRAKVVLPAPFGPAIISTLGLSDSAIDRFYLPGTVLGGL